MKKLIISFIIILGIITISGCNMLGSIVNPVIGTWESTNLGVVTVQTYNTGGSCVETITVLDVGTTKNGTWSSNDQTITRVWDDSSTDTYYYSLSSDKSEMMLSVTSGGLAITFTRQ